MKFTTIGELAAAINEGPDPDDGVHVCRGCGEHCHIPDGLEASALCNLCAQEAAAEFAWAVQCSPPSANIHKWSLGKIGKKARKKARRRG